MSKIPKTRVDIYMDMGIYYKLLNKMNKSDYKTVSQAVNHMLLEYFNNSDEQKLTADRLNAVIQQYEKKINNLEHELRIKKREKA